MGVAVIWGLVLLLLALWSALVWVGQALLSVVLNHAGSWGAGTWTLPEGLADWLPPAAQQALAEMLQSLAPPLQALLGWLPSLAGGVAMLGWVVWALGALLLVGGGVLGQMALAWWRRSQQSRSPAVPIAPR